MQAESPDTRSWARWRIVVVPLLIYAAMVLPKCGQGDYLVDTGTYAAVALQAWRGALDGDPGALWALRGQGGVDGPHYFNKPPLAFWIHGAMLALTGPALWSARLPTMLAGALLVMAVVRLTRITGGRPAAIAGGCVLATTYAYTGTTHAISLDIWQTLWCTGVLLAAVGAVDRRQPWRLAVAGVPLGLALMTKPFVGLVMLPILAIWLVSIGHARHLAWLLVTAAVGFLIAAPWHLSMMLTHDDFAAQYFGRQIVDRAAGRLGNTNEGAGSPLYYPLVLLEVYWPWMIGLVAAGVFWATGRVPAHQRAWWRLIVIASAVWLIVLSLHPDKRPRYLMPLYPIWAWAIGLAIINGTSETVRGIAARPERWLMPTIIFFGVLVGVLPVSVHSDRRQHWSELFQWLDDEQPANLWAGAFSMQQASRVYIELARWPRPVGDPSQRGMGFPATGDHIVYHAKGTSAPGDGETTVFRARNGDLLVTRLDGPSWRPVERP